MSTKQTVIFTFMILFLGVMLYALGSYCYWSTELGSAESTIEALRLQRQELADSLNGTASNLGIKKRVEDPEKGMQALAKIAQAEATRMEGNEVAGAKRVEIFYNEKERDLAPTWEKAKNRWSAVYTDWRTLNKNIATKMAELRRTTREKDEAIDKATQELQADLASEHAEQTRAVQKKKEMDEELSVTRLQNEEVRDKISSVMRDPTRSPEIKPQGRIIYAAMDLKRVSVDIGAEQGVRRDMEFSIYSRLYSGLVKKGLMKVVAVRPTSCDGVLIEKKPVLQDLQTGWVAPDPKMRYSVFSGGGTEESDPLALEKPKSKADRIEAFRQDKLEKDLGPEKADERRKEMEAPSSPPRQMGLAFAPILEGDWIHNPEFVPLVNESVHQKRMAEELLAMRDVNVSAMTFFFADSVRTYRQEFLRRLCERNGCKTTDIMSADVNYVVSVGGATRADLVERELESFKNQEDVKTEIKNLRKTLAALLDARKFGADVIAEDELESFFARRQRKLELVRGKVVQPGQAVFYIAGETKERSVDHLKRFISEHGGINAVSLDGKVDYVVMGSGLDQAFYDSVRKLGLKIIREDELPKFFGLE